MKHKFLKSVLTHLLLESYLLGLTWRAINLFFGNLARQGTTRKKVALEKMMKRTLLTFLLFCRHPPVLEKEKVGQAVNVYR